MADERVLASVNGQNITEADVERFLATLGPRGQNYRTPEGRRMILEQVINQKLFLADAARNLYEREPAFKAELARLKEELLINAPLDEVVASYALNAKNSGVDGVVCSPLEAGKIHDVCGKEFLTVTPGVRFDDATKGDQSRIATPARAKELGSDYIVVGRPITAAADPVAAYRRCVAEFVD